MSFESGAWASGNAAPSPTTIYETYSSTEVPIGLSTTPVATSKVLPVGNYHIEAVLGADVNMDATVYCKYETSVSSDTIVSNTGEAGNQAEDEIPDTIAINGTIIITGAGDKVTVACYGVQPDTGADVTSVDLTAQPVTRIKLHQT
jgi:phage-related protein